MSGSARKDVVPIVVAMGHVCRNLYPEPNGGNEPFVCDLAYVAGECALEKRLDGSKE